MIDFEDDIKFRKISIILSFIIVIFLGINLTLNIFHGRIFFVRPAFTQEKMILEDICFHGIKSILEKNPYPELLTKSNYQALSEAKFSIFDTGDIQSYGKPKIIDKTCYITAKDEKGLLAFKIELAESKGNYGYVISDVQEIETSLFKLRTQ